VFMSNTATAHATNYGVTRTTWERPGAYDCSHRGTPGIRLARERWGISQQFECGCGALFTDHFGQTRKQTP